MENKNDIRALWELLLVLTYYENTLGRIKKKNLDIKVQTTVVSLHSITAQTKLKYTVDCKILRQRVDTIKREMFSQKSVRRFVSIRHGRHVLSQCPKQRHFPPVLVPFLNISGG